MTCTIGLFYVIINVNSLGNDQFTVKNTPYIKLEQNLRKTIKKGLIKVSDFLIIEEQKCQKNLNQNKLINFCSCYAL